MTVQKKPIAILANSIHDGFQYMLTMLGDNVAEYTNQDRHRARLFDTSGQMYIVICDVVQLKGMEISDYRIAPGFGHKKNAMEIVEEASIRMR